MSISIGSVSASTAQTAQTLAQTVKESSETSSASQNASPSTVVSISTEGGNDDDAVNWDGAHGESPGVNLQMLSPLVQAGNHIRESQTYFSEPRQAANSALRSANAELVRLQDRIAVSRPSLLGKKWDFVLKDNKIEVVNDNLSSKDRQWLENTLNKNKKLVSSAQRFYGAVTKFYDHTPDHPSASGRNASGTEYAGYVIGAAGQINGRIGMRDMMDKSIESLARPKNTLSGDTTKPFLNSILLVASYLKFDSEPKYVGAQYDLSDPVTAKYFKDNLDFRG